LLEYTANFAVEYLNPSQCKKFNVLKVDFNYETMTWMPREYSLPCFDDDYILLTPRDLLTRDIMSLLVKTRF
jgi:hypothetical protein